jgi:Protein of unknown function (DUF3606)
MAHALPQCGSLENPMFYDRQIRGGGSDCKRINLRQDEELDTWARRLGATTGQVRAAVMSVGDEADKVETYLKRRWATRGWDKQSASRRG